MTWGEFKAAVEALGVTDDDQIWYIDVASDMLPAVEIERHSDLGIALT